MFGRSFAMRVGVQHRVTQPNGFKGARCRNVECALFGIKTATFVLTKVIFCHIWDFHAIIKPTYA